MIRKARAQDIDAIITITKACAKYMVSKEIFQWNEHYPNRAAFQKDLDRAELYVMELHENTIGCITLSTLMDAEYTPIHWLTENSKNLYIHRLAVHPEFQGRGFAQKLMDFAEVFAKNNNFESIRLDTFSQNERNQNFYERRNYKQLGEIYFPKQSKKPFYCYELVL